MGDGFFMQNTSQQPFSYNCIIAHFSVIFPWTVREGYFVFRHISFNIQWTFIYFSCLLSYSIYIYFVLLLFKQSSLIYMLFSFLFLFTVTKPFSSFKVFNPIQPNCCPRLQTGLLPLTLQDYVFCSKISWYKLLLDVIIVRL